MKNAVKFKVDNTHDIYESKIPLSEMMHIPIRDNPYKGKSDHDCTISAIGYVTGDSWSKIYKELSDFTMLHFKGHMLNEDIVIKSFMYYYMNFSYKDIDQKYPITLYEFILNNKDDLYVLSMRIQGNYHLTVVDHGVWVNEQNSDLDTDIINNIYLNSVVETVFMDTNQYGFSDTSYYANSYPLTNLLSIQTKNNINVFDEIITFDFPIRAISYITGMNWEQAYKDLFDYSSKYFKDHMIDDTMVTNSYFVQIMGFNHWDLREDKNSPLLPLYDFVMNNGEGIYIIRTTFQSNQMLLVCDNGTLVEDFGPTHKLDNNEILISLITDIFYK